MALTLTEANKLSNDLMLSGVIATIVSESPILSVLPFIDVVGNAVTYNRENVPATVADRAVGDTWTEDAPTFTQVSTTLKILGGDADTDNFLANSRRDTNDLEAEVLQLKAKAFAYAWEDRFLYGNATANPLQFDGLQVLIPASQRVAQGSVATPGALSLANLDAMIDKVKPGRPDFLLMSKACRRRISTYMRANSSPVQFMIDDFGHRVLSWDTIPIFVSDFISDTETIAASTFSAKTGGASTSIFACQLGPDRLAGLKNGQLPIIERFDKLETKDASRTRVKGYSSLALFSVLAAAAIDGISTAAVVA